MNEFGETEATPNIWKTEFVKNVYPLHALEFIRIRMLM